MSRGKAIVRLAAAPNDRSAVGINLGFLRYAVSLESGGLTTIQSNVTAAGGRVVMRMSDPEQSLSIAISRVGGLRRHTGPPDTVAPAWPRNLRVR